MSTVSGIQGALPRPCSACPWRLSNQGQPHPHDFYTAANLRRLWQGLRSGDAPGMTCHPTDARMAEFEGYEDTADRDEAHECQGALVLVMREVMRFQAITIAVDIEKEQGATLRRDEALRRYRAESPKGLTREGLGEWVWALMMQGTPLSRRITTTPAALLDAEVGYAPLGSFGEDVLAAAQPRRPVRMGAEA